MTPADVDEIGRWSEVKLEIIKKYATAYSTILTKSGIHHVYIDGFAGTGYHVSKRTGEFVLGSPLNALLVQPPFRRYFLIDFDGDKVAGLRDMIGPRDDVQVLEGDCNEVLLRGVFPQVRYEDFRRGLCLLDPYGMTLNWEVVRSAAAMRSLEVFLNFPIHDMNRNVLRRRPGGEDPSSVARMNAYWGDESWRAAAYRRVSTLFGEEDEKLSNQAVVNAYCDRLRQVAGFAHVAAPLPMKNSTGAVVYYLLFASHKPVAKKIVDDIYRNTGEEGPWAGRRSSGPTRPGTR